MTDLAEAISLYKQARVRYEAAVAEWDKFVPTGEEPIKTVTDWAAFLLAHNNLTAAEGELFDARKRLTEAMRAR